jgi:nicotinamide-nucleotide amidase
MDEDYSQPLEIVAGKLLRERGWKLAVAESCTGGLVGHRLTNIAGSSDYYLGSVTAYAYEAKVRLLNVRWPTLMQHGAVSREVVLEMARGVRETLEAEVGLSISGIAGPGGATAEKPVGLTWIGLSSPGTEAAWHFTFTGNRVENKASAAEAALKALVDSLKERQTSMDGVEVRARFDADGKIEPLAILWQGQEQRVDAIGRRWQTEDGLHFLVLTPSGRAFELRYAISEMRWYVVKVQPREGTT